MNELLDPRDIMILKLIKENYSIRNIRIHIGYRSPATVHEHITNLINKGYLERIAEPRVSNGWRLTDLGERTVKPYETKSNN